jgi:hypothetical protein
VPIVCGLNNNDASTSRQVPAGHRSPEYVSSAWHKWEGGLWLVSLLIQYLLSKLGKVSLRAGLSPHRITILIGMLSSLRAIEALALPRSGERPRSP